MTGGYIKLHRKILQWEWFREPETLSVFIFLLANANWLDGTWQGITIKRGQLVTSLAKIAAACGITVRQTRTALSRLKSTGEVTELATKRFRLITIEKYSLYQGEDTESDKEIDKQNDNQATNTWQTDRQRYKNIKEIKNKNAQARPFTWDGVPYL